MRHELSSLSSTVQLRPPGALAFLQWKFLRFQFTEGVICQYFETFGLRGSVEIIIQPPTVIKAELLLTLIPGDLISESSTFSWAERHWWNSNQWSQEKVRAYGCAHPPIKCRISFSLIFTHLAIELNSTKHIQADLSIGNSTSIL